MDERFEIILNKQINKFKDDIYFTYRIGTVNIIKNPNIAFNPFSCFKIANKEYYKYKNAEDYLIKDIKKLLINEFFFEIFKTTNYDVLYPNNDEDNNMLTHGSIFLKPFEFIINYEYEKIGYTYSNPDYNEQALNNLLNNYDINRLVIIDFSIDAKSTELYNNCILQNNRIQYITLESFITKHFPYLDYNLYVEKVRSAVKEANDIIGFQTISNLSVRNMRDFKKDVLKDILSFNYEDNRYLNIKKNLECGLPSNCEDHKIIKSYYFDKELHMSLIGNQSFAKCFITSEYLFRLTKNGGTFEYTSIVCGYLKSVEQLIYLLVQARLDNCPNGLWIKAKTTKKSNHTRPNPNNINTYQTMFKEEYKDEFDIDMGSLINFLDDDKDNWRISDVGKKAVCKCLKNYKQACRNENFHKDNIYSGKVANDIRKNTLVIMYYLLGSYKLNVNDSEISNVLGFRQNYFDIIYRSIATSRGINFIIEFENGNKINAIKITKQTHEQYDENGEIINTPIVFIKTDTFGLKTENEYDYLIDNGEKVIIDENHIPTKIWNYIKSDLIELVFEKKKNYEN